MIEEILPWIQLVALVVAAGMAVQAIRTTTAQLTLKIEHLSRVIDKLELSIAKMSDRLLKLEKEAEFKRGANSEREKQR